MTLYLSDEPPLAAPAAALANQTTPAATPGPVAVPTVTLVYPAATASTRLPVTSTAAVPVDARTVVAVDTVSAAVHMQRRNRWAAQLILNTKQGAKYGGVTGRARPTARFVSSGL